jgi:hypothetical protein
VVPATWIYSWSFSGFPSRERRLSIRESSSLDPNRIVLWIQSRALPYSPCSLALIWRLLLSLEKSRDPGLKSAGFLALFGISLALCFDDILRRFVQEGRILEPCAGPFDIRLKVRDRLFQPGDFLVEIYDAASGR